MDKIGVGEEFVARGFIACHGGCFQKKLISTLSGILYI